MSPKLYEMSWVTSNGDVFKNQLFTADAVSNKLLQLEKDGATDIVLKSKDTVVKDGGVKEAVDKILKGVSIRDVLK